MGWFSRLNGCESLWGCGSVGIVDAVGLGVCGCVCVCTVRAVGGVGL